MIIGTAGHIDHGKTALVHALTGVDTDRLPEEKRRGITIDLGFAPLLIPEIGTVGIVDVPGHEGFVRTMLAGASGIDMALLVIAADEGVMPQTREHLEILSLLKIRGGVVALSKCDLVDDDWIDLVRADVSALLAGTALASSEIVAVSATTGHGLEELRSAIAARLSASVRTQPEDDLFRMPIDRVFTMTGTGTVVTGTVWSGTLHRDATVRIEPAGFQARVRGIQFHGSPMDIARAGQRAAVALANVNVMDIERGDTLVTERAWRPTRELDALVHFLSADFIPSPKMRLRLHLGTAETLARVSRFRRLNSADPSANTAMATLVLDEALIARGGDRFVLRIPSPASTIGGGDVLDPFPSHDRRSRGGAHAENRSAPDRIRGLLETAGAQGLDVVDLAVRSGLARAEVLQSLASVESVILEGRAYPKELISELEQSIEQDVRTTMANHPLEAGVSLQTVRAARQAASPAVDLAIARLVERGSIEQIGSHLRPGGWKPELSESTQKLRSAVLHEIRVQPSEPPSVEEVVAKLGAEASVMIRSLEREGLLERVSANRYYSRDAIDGMVAALRTSLDPGRVYAPGELREVLGVSRKYLIPFLEFCDRKGVTERKEDGRVLKAARAAR